MSLTKTTGNTDVLLGLQWGDEGKGKIVDYLAKDYDIVARWQGGPNAGHTLWLNNDTKIVLHNLPSGIRHEHVQNFIGPGCVVNPITLLIEIKEVMKELKLTKTKVRERIMLSELATIIHPYHRYLDGAIEKSKGAQGVGTTGRGIGPAYSDTKDRVAIRFYDFLNNSNFLSSGEYASFKSKADKKLEFYSHTYDYKMPSDEQIQEDEKIFQKSLVELQQYVSFVGTGWLKNQLNQGKNVLAEGAQGVMLDNTYGCYPMVTSSNTLAGSAPIGLGIPIKYFRKTIGVAKWYTTKVGGGDFPCRIKNTAIEKILQEAGGEVGATTGRSRMCGWFDIPQINYAIEMNDVTELIITKADINPLDEVHIVTGYVVSGEVTDRFPIDTSKIQDVRLEKTSTWKHDKNQDITQGKFSFFLNSLRIHIKNRDCLIKLVSSGKLRDEVSELSY
jgi:adenylosuccinate synthase